MDDIKYDSGNGKEEALKQVDLLLERIKAALSETRSVNLVCAIEDIENTGGYPVIVFSFGERDYVALTAMLEGMQKLYSREANSKNKKQNG